MELVKDKIYYHIQRIPEWNVGETYFMGLEKNKYCGFFDLYGHNFEDPVTKQLFHPNKAADFLIEYFNTGEKNKETSKVFSYDIPFTIKSLRDVIWNYSRFLREMLFEEIRIQFFPDYPSRQRGCWVISDENDILYWIKTLGASKESAVFKVSLTGKIHEANHISLKLSTNSFNSIRKQAFNYWMTTETVQSDIGNECIFEGYIKVIDKIPIGNFM